MAGQVAMPPCVSVGGPDVGPGSEGGSRRVGSNHPSDVLIGKLRCACLTYLLDGMCSDELGEGIDGIVVWLRDTFAELKQREEEEEEEE